MLSELEQCLLGLWGKLYNAGATTLVSSGITLRAGFDAVLWATARTSDGKLYKLWQYGLHGKATVTEITRNV